MAKPQIIVGLDVGTTKICALVGAIDIANQVEIVGMGLGPSRGLKRGIVVDIDEVVASIERVIEEAEVSAGTDIDSVVVGITGGHLYSHKVRSGVSIAGAGHEIKSEDVEKAIEAVKASYVPTNHELIHLIARNFIIDGQAGVKNPVGMSGIKLEAEVLITTGLTSFIHNLLKCVENAGLEVEDIVSEAIATAEAILYPEEMELGVGLVDIGGGTTDIGIFTAGNIFYNSALPVGGNQVTGDLAFGLKTSIKEAEKIKIQYGYTYPEMVDSEAVIEVKLVRGVESRLVKRQFLDEIIRPRMEEILDLVKLELQKAIPLELLPAGVVLTGGASQLPGTIELASEILGLPVRLGKPMGITGFADTLNNPIYSTAVGLVLYGAKHIVPQRAWRKPYWLNKIINFFKQIWGRFAG